MIQINNEVDVEHILSGIELEIIAQTENKVMNEFAMLLNIDPIVLIENNKKPYICDIRHLYCKLRHDSHGVTYTEIGREIGRVRTTVKYGISRINDLHYVNDKTIVAMWNLIKDIPAHYF